MLRDRELIHLLVYMEQTIYTFISVVFYIFNKPLVLGALFLRILIIVVVSTSIKRGFLGIVVFIIYVGGLIVLFVYVFATVPAPGTNHARIYWWPVSVTILACFFRTYYTQNIVEVYDIVALLVFIGIILFLVMLSTVALAGPNKGSLKVDKYGFSYGFHMHN